MISEPSRRGRGLSSTILLDSSALCSTIVPDMSGRGALLAGLGRRARALRAERGLTLRELAPALGPLRALPGPGGGGRGQHLGAEPGPARAAPSAPRPRRSWPPPSPTAPAAARDRAARPARRGQDHHRPAPGPPAARALRGARPQGRGGGRALRLAEIFALHGEAYYRRLERETLDRLLAEGRPLVLASGGGLVTGARHLRAAAPPRAHGLAARGARGPLEPRGPAGRPPAHGRPPAGHGRAAPAAAPRASRSTPRPRTRWTPRS